MNRRCCYIWMDGRCVIDGWAVDAVIDGCTVDVVIDGWMVDVL